MESNGLLPRNGVQKSAVTAKLGEAPALQDRSAGAEKLAVADLPLPLLLIAAFAGLALALVTIPAWVPELARSMIGAEPKVYWYLARASGFTAFFLLWLAMASGLLISNKMARIWPGAWTTFDLHQYTSLLGLGFVAFHVLILLGDSYIGYNLFELLMPFAGTEYRTAWVALGQVSLYLLLLVTFTFYIRKQIGNKLWHAIHFLSYGMFGLIMLHGLFSGTDSGNGWVVALYWLAGVSLLALTIYRLMLRQMSTAKA